MMLLFNVMNVSKTNHTDGVMGEIKKSHKWEKPKRTY